MGDNRIKGYNILKEMGEGKITEHLAIKKEDDVKRKEFSVIWVQVSDEIQVQEEDDQQEPGEHTQTLPELKHKNEEEADEILTFEYGEVADIPLTKDIIITKGRYENAEIYEDWLLAVDPRMSSMRKNKKQ